MKKQRYYFANKGPSSQGYGFSSSHKLMWELAYKESWAPKNWCFFFFKTLHNCISFAKYQNESATGIHVWIDAFELWCWRRLLRVPWTARRSNQSIIKEISPECSSSRTDAEAENPILWPPDAKNWLIWKAPDAGKGRRREEKGTTEDEVRWHHRLNGHEFV